ncbi:MAG: hypothetical protein IPK71_16020 [Myxococcales bacterium]|nr:hypothetical protein [Myxococcales bacterium]
MRTVVAAAPALVALALALSPSDARADVPPPNSSGCTTKKAGDGCTRDDGAQGTCATSTCSRINYDCDGGKTPCGQVSYDCLTCGAGGASGDGGAADGGSGGSTSSSSCAASPRGAAPGVFAVSLAVLAALVLARRSSKES